MDFRGTFWREGGDIAAGGSLSSLTKGSVSSLEGVCLTQGAQCPPQQARPLFTGRLVLLTMGGLCSSPTLLTQEVCPSLIHSDRPSHRAFSCTAARLLHAMGSFSSCRATFLLTREVVSTPQVQSLISSHGAHHHREDLPLHTGRLIFLAQASLLPHTGRPLSSTGTPSSPCKEIMLSSRRAYLPHTGNLPFPHTR